MTIDASSMSVDAMLDYGAPGLQYFEQLAPRYERAFNGLGGNSQGRYNCSQLFQRYDEQRGMDVTKLEQAIDGIDRAIGVADEQWEVQKSKSDRLPEVWQGAAANAAHTMLAQQVGLADEDRKNARKALDELRKAPKAFRDAVAGKADYAFALLKGLTDVKVDGKSVDDIDNIISGAQIGNFIDVPFHEDLLDKLCKIFPGLESPGGSPVAMIETQLRFFGSHHPLGNKVRDTCSEWLNDVFKKEYDEKVGGFVDQCNTAHTTISATYDAIAATMKIVDDNPYPSPVQDKPVTTTPEPATTPGPATMPAGTTPGPATAPASTPSMPAAPQMQAIDGLAGLSQAANQAAPLLSGLTSAAGQGLTALKGQIDDAVGKLTEAFQPNEADKDHDGQADDSPNGKDDSKPTAEFDIGGKHWKFEVGPDGELKLVLSDKEGNPQEFSVKLDENGRPVVSTGDSAEDDGTGDDPAKSTQSNPEAPVGAPESEQPENTAPPQSAREPAQEDQDDEQRPIVPPVPSAPRPGEDKEDSPTPNVAQPTPGVADTGARLSEAGPL